MASNLGNVNFFAGRVKKIWKPMRFPKAAQKESFLNTPKLVFKFLSGFAILSQ